MLPKLCLYIRTRMPVELFKGPIPIRLTLPNGVILPLGEIDDDLIAKSVAEARANELPIAGIAFYATLQGFQIGKSGLIRAILEHKGEEQTCAVLNVKAAIST